MTKLKGVSYSKKNVELTADCRGIPLKEGDNVLCLYHDSYSDFNFDKIILDKNTSKLKLAKHSSDYIYIVNLNNFNLLSFKNYINKIDYDTDNRDYLDLSGSLLLYTLFYKYRLNKGSLRGFPMLDYLGQDLSVGDFVIFRDGNDSAHFLNYEYGIVVSNEKVFSESCLIKRSFISLKLNELTEEEKLIYEKLSLEYKQRTLKQLDTSNFKLGDVYVSGKNYYLYLGNFDLKIDQIKESNSVCSIQWDSTKPYWIKLKKSLNNYKDINFILYEYLLSSYVMSEHKVSLTDLFYYTYQSIDSFSCFTNKLPKSAIYNSKIELPNDVLINFKNVSGSYYDAMSAYTFEFIFK